MSDYMPSEFQKQINYTTFQSIFGGFSNKTFDMFRKSWIVKKLNGTSVAHEDAQLLSQILAKVMSDAVMHGVGEIQESLLGMGDKTAEPVDEEIMKLQSLLGKPKEKQGINDKLSAFSNKAKLLESQISIIEPQEGSIDIFPRAWYCKKCGFYRVASPFELKSLSCPWCKDKFCVCSNPACPERNKTVKFAEKCEHCGHKTNPQRFSQLSLLFVCPVCAKQEEICPPFVKPETAPKIFICDVCGQPMRLALKRPLSRSKWECIANPKHTKSVVQFCSKCSNWSKDESARKPVMMKLKAASANYLKPVIFSAFKIGDSLEINKQILENFTEWKLSGQSGPEWDKIKSEIIRYGIEDLWLIKEIKSFTINYGYQYNSFDEPKITNFYTSVDPRNKQIKYKCYVAVSNGKGLYIKLNKKRIIDVIEPKKPRNYEEIADAAISKIQESSPKELKDKGNDLFSLLHSVSHAILQSASIITGLNAESFAEKILVKDCGILLAERENVGTGGLDYVVQRKLLDWLVFSKTGIDTCRYDCQNGCPKCLFIRDPLCNPLLPFEGGTKYFIPNSLLSRKHLIAFWGDAT